MKPLFAIACIWLFFIAVWAGVAAFALFKNRKKTK